MKEYDRNKGQWSYSVSDVGWFRTFTSRREHKSWFVRWWGMPRAWLAIAWCKWRHRPWHVMGMPSAGRVLRYPIFCHGCGCRWELIRTYENKLPAADAAHVYLDRFLKAKGVKR